MSSEACCYTPGLKRKATTVVRKTRILPIPGEVLVREKEEITADTIIARAFILGEVHVANVAALLGIEYWETSKYLLKKKGEEVEKDEPIAMIKSLFGLLKRTTYAPASGTIERVSDVSGQVLIRESKIPLDIDAYIPGKVMEILPNEGATIETPAAFIQGIFGIGGERKGKLTLVAKTPNEILTAAQLKPEHKGKILIGGARVTDDALQKAGQIGVKGIVVGGIDDHDLTTFLGYKIGVAITGHEDIPITLIITEGFGEMAMSEKTFSLLKKFNGKDASINGATQIRAGVLRPEIIIPMIDEVTESSKFEDDDEKDYLQQGLLPGTPIRIIRDPFFGALGIVSKLPVKLQTIETESSVRVLEAKLADGRHVIVPRANVEIIEE
ncbi:MAG: hypothetical protein JSV05_00340 [Candidatus Bathyarchaeota archaeon]|nr:MAG: hypothetical protein JSV05_00340 [Candidatus Bathyarchaeota archaeon]